MYILVLKIEEKYHKCSRQQNGAHSLRQKKTGDAYSQSIKNMFAHCTFKNMAGIEWISSKQNSRSKEITKVNN
jgi:hypothetical protein